MNKVHVQAALCAIDRASAAVEIIRAAGASPGAVEMILTGLKIVKLELAEGDKNGEHVEGS